MTYHEWFGTKASYLGLQPHEHDAGDVTGAFSQVRVIGDIFSTNWDGAIPANLGGAIDPNASAGLYLDSSAGMAQFAASVYVGSAGNLYSELTAASLVFTDSSGRTAISSSTAGLLELTGWDGGVACGQDAPLILLRSDGPAHVQVGFVDRSGQGIIQFGPRAGEDNFDLGAPFYVMHAGSSGFGVGIGGIDWGGAEWPTLPTGMTFYTSADGYLPGVRRLSIDSAGLIYLSTDTDSYLEYAAANNWAFYMGGTKVLDLYSTHVDASVALKIAGQAVTFGANDSGGAGYRLVRVPNTT